MNVEVRRVELVEMRKRLIVSLRLSDEGAQGEKKGHDIIYKEGAGADEGDKAPSRCIRCQNGQGNILPLQCQGLLAAPLTAHAPLLHLCWWLVTIIVISALTGSLWIAFYTLWLLRLENAQMFSCKCIG